MQRRLVYTDEVMRHLTAEYNRRAVGTGLRLASIEKAVNATPTAGDYQVPVTWYPEEMQPEEGKIVVVSISGQAGGCTYDHAFALATWVNDGLGWMIEDVELDSFEVHAWCDLEPFGGRDALAARRTDG